MMGMIAEPFVPPSTFIRDALKQSAVLAGILVVAAVCGVVMARAVVNADDDVIRMKMLGVAGPENRSLGIRVFCLSLVPLAVPVAMWLWLFLLRLSHDREICPTALPC